VALEKHQCFYVAKTWAIAQPPEARNMYGERQSWHLPPSSSSTEGCTINHGHLLRFQPSGQRPTFNLIALILEMPLPNA
jgi:hypothetical protein